MPVVASLAAVTLFVLAATAAGAGIVAPHLLSGVAADRTGRQSLAPSRCKKGKDILYAIEHVVNDRGAFVFGNRWPVLLETEVFLGGLRQIRAFGLFLSLFLLLLLRLSFRHQAHQGIERIGHLIIGLEFIPGVCAQRHAAGKPDRPGMAPGAALFILRQHGGKAFATAQIGHHRLPMPIDELEDGCIGAPTAQGSDRTIGLTQYQGQPLLACNGLGAAGQCCAKAIEFLDGHGMLGVYLAQTGIEVCDFGIRQRPGSRSSHPGIVQVTPPREETGPMSNEPQNAASVARPASFEGTTLGGDPARAAGRLKGKRAIVTGAGSGIGRATALLFAAEGAQVLAADRSAEGLQATVDAAARLDLSRHGGRLLTATADAGAEADVRALVDRAVKELGGLEVIYANAGVSGGGIPITEQTVELWQETLRVNLIGPFLAIKHAGAHMAAQGKGSIICTASVAALRSNAGGNPYSASKAGVVSLVQTSANSFWGTGVRVNAICPGLIETGMTRPVFERAREAGQGDKLGQINPLARYGLPQEIAAMALFLASDESSYVNGQALAVDGGLTSSHPFKRRSL